MCHRHARSAVVWTAFTFATFLAAVNLRGQSASTAASPSPAPPPADVPVREVVLFSSGVGYFQHEGTVRGDGSTELRFKTEQINDILKSLVLQDLDGGHVGVVTYPSNAPLAKTLGSFQVDISDNPSLSSLLIKLRGARVSLAYTGANGVENFGATVLGVEQREIPGAAKDSGPLTKEFLNVVTDRGIRSLELDQVDRLQLEDRGLQEELDRALAAIAGARDQDKKPVDIHFNGAGDRRVRIGYVVETPIWKASYRLIMPDATPEGDAKASASGTLQGWAIVENQTDNDWNDVRLSLISGRPISFVEDLYQPLFVPRPVVTPDLYTSLRPQEYAGGIVAESGPASRAGGVYDKASENQVALAKSTRRAAVAAAPAAMPTPGADGFTTLDEFRSKLPIDPGDSVAALGDASKLGALFQYTVAHVSLARQRSAMIPILNDPIEVERVSIFNQSVLATHPLNGARVKNTSADAKHLLAGPVTVFDEGRYAGDARLDDVPPGQTRLLSYGIDLEVQVKTDRPRNSQNVLAGKVVKGALELTRKSVSENVYKTDNQSDRARTMIIEHPVRAGWKLADTPAPVETTDALYRFQQDVPAHKTEAFTVKEENVQSQTIALLPMSVSDLQSYTQTGEIAAPVRDALAKAITLKQAAVETQRQIDDRQGQVKALADDQERIRENIKSIDRSSAYATRLLKKLDDQESQLDKLRAEIDNLRGRLNTENGDLATYLNGLNVN